VPGGFAEASALPKLANAYFDEYALAEDFADVMVNTFKSKAGVASSIAFVHATSYAEDRQAMQFLSDCFRENGMHTVFAAPDHIRWENKKAYSIVEGNECGIDGIIRFYPLEWVGDLPRSSEWRGFFDCETLSCNHPVSIMTQSKRLPLVWDRLDVKIPAWRELLPETKSPRDVDPQDRGWVYKPAPGRVGEGIAIEGVTSNKEFSRIRKVALRDSKTWVSQRMFDSAPIKSPSGEDYHLCLGAFTVDGKFAGFYGRISLSPLIDCMAEEIPVLVG